MCVGLHNLGFEAQQFNNQEQQWLSMSVDTTWCLTMAFCSGSHTMKALALSPNFWAHTRHGAGFSAYPWRWLANFPSHSPFLPEPAFVRTPMVLELPDWPAWASRTFLVLAPWLHQMDPFAHSSFSPPGSSFFLLFVRPQSPPLWPSAKELPQGVAMARRGCERSRWPAT